MKENWHPSKLELRVQEFARSKASKQLLQVPYDDFAKASRQYVQWEAFSLWIRVVLQFEDEVPRVVRMALQEHCASFVNGNISITEPAQLRLQLDEWINRRKIFARARREEWFEALLFYTVRDPQLKYVCAYWEQCESEWANKRTRRYPEFEAWVQSALHCAQFPVNADRLGKAVDRYLDWLSLAYWLEPLLENDCAFPSYLLAELKMQDRRFREFAKQLESGERCALSTRFHLVNWIENRYFSEAREQTWLESLRRHARNHPRYARISEYARRWRAQRPQDRARRYPSFVSWSQEAETFVEKVRR